MSWLQQQPFLWPWQMLSCPVDDYHPEYCCRDPCIYLFFSSLLWPSGTSIALQHQLPLLHFIRHRLFALIFKALHSLFPLRSSSPIQYQETNSCFVLLLGGKSLHLLIVWFLFIYYIGILVLSPCAAFRPWEESSINVSETRSLISIRFITLKAPLLQWCLVKVWC